MGYGGEEDIVERIREMGNSTARNSFLGGEFIRVAEYIDGEIDESIRYQMWTSKVAEWGNAEWSGIRGSPG